MTTFQIVCVICGILFVILAALALWGYFHRKNNQYDIVEIENSNWLMKLIKSNITLIWIIIFACLVIIAVTFFMTAAKTTN